METIDDIVREMRRYADEDAHVIGRDVLRRDIQTFADRLEKAHEADKRKLVEAQQAAEDALWKLAEKEGSVVKHDLTTATDINVGSNAAKMREALERILNLAYIAKEDGGRITNDWLIDTCKTALSAPPRNCDVGTAEEQGARFRGFCDKHNCERCPVGGDEYLTNCFSRWSQMPYEKGETK